MLIDECTNKKDLNRTNARMQKQDRCENFNSQVRAKNAVFNCQQFCHIFSQILESGRWISNPNRGFYYKGVRSGIVVDRFAFFLTFALISLVVFFFSLLTSLDFCTAFKSTLDWPRGSCSSLTKIVPKEKVGAAKRAAWDSQAALTRLSLEQKNIDAAHRREEFAQQLSLKKK